MVCKASYVQSAAPNSNLGALAYSDLLRVPGEGAYDSAGNMTKRTDEEAIQVDFGYDSLNRITQRNKSGATTDVEKYAFDALGRVITAKKGTSTTDDSVSKSIFSYDKLSRLTKESQAISGGSAKDVVYSFDKAGNQITMIYHDACNTLAYNYDSRDRGTAIDFKPVGAGGFASLAAYGWIGDVLGERTSLGNKSYALAGITSVMKFKSDFQRDGLLRCTKLANKYLVANQSDSGYDNLGTFDYTYDSASNLLTAYQSPSMGYNAVSRTYAYDTLDRLVTARLKETQDWSSPAFKTSWYNYDDLGNRKTSANRDAASVTYAHDLQNRLTTFGSLTHTYSASGNQLTAHSVNGSTSYNYEYDHLNQLTRVATTSGNTQKATFAWDALGRRIEFIDNKNTTTTRYYYDGANQACDYNQSGTRQRFFVHGLSYIDPGHAANALHSGAAAPRGACRAGEMLMLGRRGAWRCRRASAMNGACEQGRAAR